MQTFVWYYVLCREFEFVQDDVLKIIFVDSLKIENYIGRLHLMLVMENKTRMDAKKTKIFCMLVFVVQLGEVLLTVIIHRSLSKTRILQVIYRQNEVSRITNAS